MIKLPSKTELTDRFERMLLDKLTQVSLGETAAREYQERLDSWCRENNVNRYATLSEARAAASLRVLFGVGPREWVFVGEPRPGFWSPRSTPREFLLVPADFVNKAIVLGYLP